MSWRTHKWMILARDLGRSLGLNKRIAVLLNGSGYEIRYDGRFSSAMRADDCVWDVGANVGYYTRQFSKRAGDRGIVFAFEPSPVNFPRLLASTAEMLNVKPLQIGLGLQNGQLAFQQGEDDLGATSRIVASGRGGSLVEIRTGSSLIESGDVSAPNVIKIDVEGFELEVVQGLGRHLDAEALRAIGIEVHFEILKSRGLSQAPQQIEKLLEQRGFAVSWPDSSHMLALRRNR
jgi:FkbM family methyltransferase